LEQLLKSKIENAVWGFIIGDALGVPYEFSSRESMKLNPIMAMVGHRTHNQPPGTWSDDTSMMLCVLEYFLESIGADRNHDINNLNYALNIISSKFINWYQRGEYTSGGNVFDIGGATRWALNNIIETNDINNCGVTEIKTGCGNGALMRCLPIAFFLSNKSELVRNKYINSIGAITHNTYISYYCCVFYIEMIIQLTRGKSKYESCDFAKNVIEKYLDEESKGGYINRDPFKRLHSSISSVSINDIKSGGYVIDTLESVLWVFLNTNSYEEAVFSAINLGGDTDTIAALVGAIAGIYYEDINSSWKNSIVNKELVIKLLNRLNT
jgi:ADP-ribosylglycohydrolase